MKNVVLVSGDFTTHGGMDCANFHLAKYLADQPDCAVHLVAFHVEEPLATHPNVTWHQARKWFNSYTLSERSLDRAGRAVASSLPDACVIVNGGNCTWGDVNWVHYVHAAWDAESSGSLALRIRRAFQHRRNRTRERRIIRDAKLVIANSDRTRKDLIDRLGIDPQRVKTVYYGIDPQLFCPPPPEHREAMRRALSLDPATPAVAFIGALGDRRKGFDLLFEAWDALTKRGGWDAKLLVIGQGAQLPYWQSRATDSGLNRNIRFLGFRRDIADVLKACDSLVSPTRYEAYGLGVHEALCCGLPAIVSGSAGVAERYPASLAAALLIPEPLTVDGVMHRLAHWRDNMQPLATQTRVLSDALRIVSWDTMAKNIVELLSPQTPMAQPTSARSPAYAGGLL
jgi:glycosyltransferase involved in cell wall biosynthesis